MEEENGRKNCLFFLKFGVPLLRIAFEMAIFISRRCEREASTMSANVWHVFIVEKNISHHNMERQKTLSSVSYEWVPGKKSKKFLLYFLCTHHVCKKVLLLSYKYYDGKKGETDQYSHSSNDEKVKMRWRNRTKTANTLFPNGIRFKLHGKKSNLIIKHMIQYVKCEVALVQTNTSMNELAWVAGFASHSVSLRGIYSVKFFLAFCNSDMFFPPLFYNRHNFFTSFDRLYLCTRAHDSHSDLAFFLSTRPTVISTMLWILARVFDGGEKSVKIRHFRSLENLKNRSNLQISKWKKNQISIVTCSSLRPANELRKIRVVCSKFGI